MWRVGDGFQSKVSQRHNSIARHPVSTEINNMYIIDRTLRFTRGFLLSYGPTPIKKFFWDQEFSSGKWNFIDDTSGDCVYSHLERFAKDGSILDLGCGPGNTANELAPIYR